MSITRAHMGISLDGFTSGINQRLEVPFGDNTEGFNDWMFRLAFTKRNLFGQDGGETGPSNDVLVERFANIGANIMGRHMFGGGSGPWKTDPPWKGWWGESPPYHTPVFVLTHHPREPLVMQGGTTFHFVTEGPEAALARAKEAAGDKDVVIAGGAQTVRQYLRLGAIDELELHVVAAMIGAGERLLDGVPKLHLEQLRALPGNGVTHLRYRIVR